MGLSCDCNWDPCLSDFDWLWRPPSDFTTYKSKRGQKCVSCGDMVRLSDDCAYIERVRAPTEFEYEKLNLEEVNLAYWVWCGSCAGLAFSLSDLGYCFEIDDNMPALVKEHAAAQSEKGSE